MNDVCSIELLTNAVANRLTADEETALYDHLERCEACCALMEQLAGGEQWQQEAAALLTTDELDAAVPETMVWSEVDFSVEHLEPSEDPNVLGQLGGYDVLAIIGRGGMGVVLKAFDRELKRFVAIKALSPHLAHNSVARKRFAREAQAAAAVVNPHVIAIHHVQPTGRLPFLIMPLLTGETLAQRLKSRAPLELTEVLRIGMQAAVGLAAAHDQGLVHRDVKPANIFLEKGVERVVITDFGLARAADDVSMTRLGVVAGTPEYMSPEQARGEALDARSDLFSLGCVLYEMATGVSPFRSDSTIATLRRIVDDKPAAIASLAPELPPWFSYIVERLLSKDPTQRFASASEVSQLLEACLSHLQQPTSVPLPASLMPHANGRRSIFNSNKKGILTMLGTLGMALLGMVLWQSTDPPDISGQWASDEWGTVVLEVKGPGKYEGTFTGSGKDNPAPRNAPPGAGEWTGTITTRSLDVEVIAHDPPAPSARLVPAGGPDADAVSSGGPVDSPNGSGAGLRSGPIGPVPMAFDFPGGNSFYMGFTDQEAGQSRDGIDTKTKSGTLHLKWSRVERRFNGTWGKGADRRGSMSLRLVDKEIRGGFTTDEEVQLETGTPLVGDLLWKRNAVTVPDGGIVLLGGSKPNDKAEGPTDKGPGIAEPLDRQNALAVVEAFVKATLTGDVETARALASDLPPAYINESWSVTKLPIQSVYVNDPAKPTRALAISEAVDVQYNEPPVMKRGSYLLTLIMSDEGWSVFDIGWEEEPDVHKAVKKFLEAHPNAVRLSSHNDKQQNGPAAANVQASDTPLGRQNARTVVEAFVKATLTGEMETAKTLARDLPPAYISERWSVTKLPIQSVYVDDPANPRRALATSESIAIQVNSEMKRGSYLFTLIMSEEGWYVFDIDCEEEPDVHKAVKKFLEAHPNAVRSSSLDKKQQDGPVPTGPAQPLPPANTDDSALSVVDETLKSLIESLKPLHGDWVVELPGTQFYPADKLGGSAVSHFVMRIRTNHVELRPFPHSGAQPVTKLLLLPIQDAKPGHFLVDTDPSAVDQRFSPGEFSFEVQHNHLQVKLIPATSSESIRPDQGSEDPTHFSARRATAKEQRKFAQNRFQHMRMVGYKNPDRTNPEAVVEAYVAASLAGDVAIATSLAEGYAARTDQSTGLNKHWNLNDFAIKSVRVRGQVVTPMRVTAKEAIVVSELMHRTSPATIGDVSIGHHVSRLKNLDGKWVISAFDLWTTEHYNQGIGKFLNADSEVIGVPQEDVDGTSKKPSAGHKPCPYCEIESKTIREEIQANEARSSELPGSEELGAYISAIRNLPDSATERFKFYWNHLEHENEEMADDSSKEIELALHEHWIADVSPFDFKPVVDLKQLRFWLKDAHVPEYRRRVYIHLLGVCGNDEDTEVLKRTISNGVRENPNTNFQAQIEAYVMLGGPVAWDFVEHEILQDDLSIPDTSIYSMIRAVRFLDTHSKVIARDRMLQSLHLMLDRPSLADLVVKELIRMEDWSQVGRLVALLKSADEDSKWVRLPIVQYLQACPLPEAAEELKKLREISKAVERALQQSQKTSNTSEARSLNDETTVDN